MAATVKIKFDKATVRQLFKVVVGAADVINDTSFVHGPIADMANRKWFCSSQGRPGINKQ